MICHKKKFDFFGLYQKNTTIWYSEYHAVVVAIPRCGTHATTAWYSQYQSVVSISYLQFNVIGEKNGYFGISWRWFMAWPPHMVSSTNSKPMAR